MSNVQSRNGNGRFNSFEEINSGKKSRIFNKRIYEITNGEEFKRF
jgi:hypothetical protein